MVKRINDFLAGWTMTIIGGVFLLASFILPPATFYAITCFLLGQYHWVYLAMTGASLFTIIAMLIPAIDEFDTVTGRTTE